MIKPDGTSTIKTVGGQVVDEHTGVRAEAGSQLVELLIPGAGEAIEFPTPMLGPVRDVLNHLIEVAAKSQNPSFSSPTVGGEQPQPAAAELEPDPCDCARCRAKRYLETNPAAIEVAPGVVLIPIFPPDKKAQAEPAKANDFDAKPPAIRLSNAARKYHDGLNREDIRNGGKPLLWDDATLEHRQSTIRIVNNVLHSAGVDYIDDVS